MKSKEILRTMYLNYGEDVFKDSYKLSVYIKDLLCEFETEQKQYLLAVREELVTKMMENINDSLLEKTSFYADVLVSTYGVSEQIANDILSAFYYAITGEEVQKSEPETFVDPWDFETIDTIETSVETPEAIVEYEEKEDTIYIDTTIERQHKGVRFDKSNFSKELAGEQGYALCELVSKGFPVLSGFVLSTQSSEKLYIDSDKSLMWYYTDDELKREIERNIAAVEEMAGRKFGDTNGNPLLLTIRASFNHKAMADFEIKYIGLNDAVVEGIGKVLYNEQWAWKKYCSYIKDYSCDILEIGKMYFEDPELLAIRDYKKLSDEYKSIYKRLIGKDFPQDLKTQVFDAVTAVYREWTNPRNVIMRQNNGQAAVPPAIGIVAQMTSHSDLPYGTSGCTLKVSKNSITNNKEYEFISKQDESISSFADYSNKYSRESEMLKTIINRLDENVNYIFVDFVCEGGFWYIVNAELQ